MKKLLKSAGTPPRVMITDRDDDLVQMPFVTAGGSALADPIGERLAEFPSPLAHGFIASVTPMPRAASISSTIRKLKGNRKYNQTA
ncbi:hypothetical protein ACVII1_000080 [Bradyrhizobium elkanii]